MGRESCVAPGVDSSAGGRCTVWYMIVVTKDCTAPAHQLWALLSDVRRWGDWLPTVDSVTPVDPSRPDEVGAEYVVEQPGLRRAVWMITSRDEGRQFTWESRQPGVLTVATHELRPGPDGTTTVELGITWSGPLAPLVRLAFGRKTRDYVTREAEALEATASARA